MNVMDLLANLFKKFVSHEFDELSTDLFQYLNPIILQKGAKFRGKDIIKKGILVDYLWLFQPDEYNLILRIGKFDSFSRAYDEECKNLPLYYLYIKCNKGSYYRLMDLDSQLVTLNSHGEEICNLFRFNNIGDLQKMKDDIHEYVLFLITSMIK